MSFNSKLYFNVIVFFFLCFLCKAQSNDFNYLDSAFFTEKTPAMKVWLNRQGVSPLLSNVIIQTVPNYVILRLKADTPEKWLRLRQDFQEKQSISLEKNIFDAFVSRMQAGEDSVLLYINFDKDSYQIQAGLDSENDYEFVIEEQNKPRGIILGTPFDLPSTAFSHKEDTTISGSVQVVRKKIEVFLENKYKGKEGWFWSAKSQYPYRTAYDSVAYIKVENIKNEIIDDCYICYYEKLDVRVSISKVDNGRLRLTCQIEGFYGGGLFQPRRSDYKDMEEEYKEYLNNYIENLRNELGKYLTQN